MTTERPADRFVLGIDVGGTKIAAALVDEGGAVGATVRVETPARDPTEVVDAIVQAARHAWRPPSSPGDAPASAPLAIGVAIAGHVDTARGIWLRAANLNVDHLPLREILQQRLGLAVRIVNDTNAAALAEARFGAGRGASPIAYVTIGTGIGAGIVAGGTVFAGARGLAGEIGHTIVEKDGPLCNCGNRGCLEAVAAGPALARRAVDLARALPGSPLAALDRQIAADDVFDAAAAGDSAAALALDEVARYLAIGLSNLVELIDPERVVVGGGVARAGPALFERIDRSLRQQRLRSLPIGDRIVASALGDNAGLIGAAVVAFDCL